MGSGTTASNGKIDLHSHSRASDGEFPPEDVAVRARAAGLAVWSLCDHDTVAGLEDASAAAQRHGMRFVPGIELSAFLRGHEIHLLGHFVDPGHPALERFEDFLAVHRRGRIAKIVERLAALGIRLRVQDIERWSGGKTLGRPHVARAILEAGAVATVKEAFDRYLGEGKAAYVGRFRLEASDAVELVRGAGGTTTVAHPGVSRIGRRELERLRAVGVVGVEVHHVEHDQGMRARLLRMAAKLDLVPTAGSDYHGETVAPDRHFGDVTMSEEDLARLEARRP